MKEKKPAITIEDQIRKDGSLSEERKTELLRLVSTMKPEMKTSRTSQGTAKGLIKSSTHPNQQEERKKTPKGRK